MSLLGFKSRWPGKEEGVRLALPGDPESLGAKEEDSCQTKETEGKVAWLLSFPPGRAAACKPSRQVLLLSPFSLLP